VLFGIKPASMANEYQIECRICVLNYFYVLQCSLISGLQTAHRKHREIEFALAHMWRDEYTVSIEFIEEIEQEYGYASEAVD